MGAQGSAARRPAGDARARNVTKTMFSIVKFSPSPLLSNDDDENSSSYVVRCQGSNGLRGDDGAYAAGVAERARSVKRKIEREKYYQ